MTSFLKKPAPPPTFGKPPDMQADVEAVTACYQEEITCIAHALRQRSRVLVHCDCELVDYLVHGVAYLLRDERQPRFRVIDPFLVDSSFPGTFDQFVKRIRECLPDPHEHWKELRGSSDAKELPVIVLRHAGMLAGYATSNASALLFLQYLQGSPYRPVVGFIDPAVHDSVRQGHLKLLDGVFSINVRISGISRQHLPQALWKDAAELLTDNGEPATEDLNRIHQYVGDMNAVELRRVLSAVLGAGSFLPRRSTQSLAQKTPDPLIQVRELAGKYPIQRPERVERKHIGGYQTIKEKLEENFILPYKLGHYDRMGRGILFHGPPGTGKTFFAKWLATELSAYLLMINGPEVKSKWHGESERLIREIFQRARDNQPAVIVMDEFDALGRARDMQPHSGGADIAIVNTLLAELGGLRSPGQVVFIATTNYLEAIDQALRNRLGRIEYSIHIDYPSREDARDILRVNLEGGQICGARPEMIPSWIDAIIPESPPPVAARSSDHAAVIPDLFSASQSCDGDVRSALTGDDLRILCERMDRIYHVAVALLKNRTEENRELCSRFLAKFTNKKKVTMEEFCERIRDSVLREFLEAGRAGDGARSESAVE